MATRYVTKHGSASDSNGGTNATTDAWATAIKGFSSISGGDTLVFGTGTYDIDRSSLQTPIPNGSSGSPTIITDNGDGAVTFHWPGSGNIGIIYLRDVNKGYISFIGTATNQLIFDAEGQSGCFSTIYLGDPACHHINFTNCWIKGSDFSGVTGGSSSDITYDGCHISGNGSRMQGTTPIDHGIYQSGPNLIVKNCRFYDNYGWGLHCYDLNYSGREIYNNWFYNNGYGDGNGHGAGLIMSNGSGTIYNNICFENAGAGIELWRTTNATVYHNICHANGWYGIDVGRASGNATSNTLIKNNILIDNGLGPLRLLSTCTGTVATWNRLGSGESLDTSGDSGGTYNNNTADAVAIQAESGGYSGEWTDPENATLASRDYTLVAAAKSIWNASTNDVPTVGIATDIAGTSRAHPDQGPHAFGTPDPPDPPVIGHLTNYPVTAWTLEDIALTLFDNDNNTKNLTLDGSTDGVSIEFGDTTNCTVT